MNTKEIGLIGESLAITEFVKLGIPVYLPFGENTKCDLIIDIANKLYKCQVKTTERIINDKFCNASVGKPYAIRRHNTNY